MSHTSLPPNGSQPRMPPRPQTMMPPMPPTHTEIPYTAVVQIVTARLTSHPDYRLYSPVIQGLLEADDNDWRAVMFIRFRSRSALFRDHYRELYYYPPPEIFRMIMHIRNDRRWDMMRPTILNHMNHARQSSSSSVTTSNTSGRGPAQRLTPPTASTQSTSGHDNEPRPGHRTGKRGPPSPYAAGSPTPTDRLASTGGRTAPDGYLYYCGSRNCRRSYPRRGYQKQKHYENHMQSNHAEWPPHDPASSLRPIPILQHPDHSNIPGTRGAVISQPSLLTSAPRTPRQRSPQPARVRPATPNPDTVLPDIRETGTQPEVFRPFGATFDTTPVFGHNQIQLEFLDGRQNFFSAPSSQTSSHPGHSYFPPDAHMHDD